VTAQYKGTYRIIANNYEGLAEVSGKLRFDAKYLSDYPAVGDFVMADSRAAVIHRVLQRASSFERACGVNGTQVVAANIDIVFICMSLNNDYNLSRLERYLSVAWGSGATPVVVLTKSDLCDDPSIPFAEASTAAPGTDVVITSSFDNSVQEIEKYLKQGITTSFIGSSGVGKSTLINCLAGEELFATSEIRQDDKGRHTTTHRELVLLSGGSMVIDTPGIRELGVETVDLSKSFADIEELSHKCRFRDCNHISEPGCTVLEAIESGTLDARRLENYRKLELEAKYNSLNARQIEAAKIDTMFGGKAAMKKALGEIKKKNRRR
jgi:ribosome biogenesis GTPase